jgi:hypothetical protein
MHPVRKIISLANNQDTYLLYKLSTALTLLAKRMSREEGEMLMSMNFVLPDKNESTFSEETEVYGDWVILAVKAKPVPQALAAVHALAKYLNIDTKVTTKLKETYATRHDLMITIEDTSKRFQKDILDLIMKRYHEVFYER